MVMAGSMWRSHVRGHDIVEENFVIREIRLAGTHCFDPDSVLGDLTKVNYVFGPNGSGKTTISAGLVEFSTDPTAVRALDVQWEASHQTIKVYNRNYMRKAFTSVDGEEPGVFLLGEEDGAAYQQIQDISVQKTKADQKASSAQDKLDQRLEEVEELRSDLADKVWNKRSVIPQGLQKHMPGLRGRKEACLEKVLAAAEAHSERGVDDLEALAKKAEGDDHSHDDLVHDRHGDHDEKVRHCPHDELADEALTERALLLGDMDTSGRQCLRGSECKLAGSL